MGLFGKAMKSNQNEENMKRKIFAIFVVFVIAILTSCSKTEEVAKANTNTNDSPAVRKSEVSAEVNTNSSPTNEMVPIAPNNNADTQQQTNQQGRPPKTSVPKQPKTIFEIIPVPEQPAMRKMDIARMSDVDGHNVIVAFVVNERYDRLGEVVEFHDYNNDSIPDGVFYTNVIDIQSNKIWIAGWWKGTEALNWFKTKGVGIKPPENLNETQVGYYDVDTFFNSTSDLEMVRSDLGDMFLFGLFNAGSDIVGGVLAMEKGKPEADAEQRIQKGVDALMRFLGKRGKFAGYGAKVKTEQELSLPNKKLFPRVNPKNPKDTTANRLES